MASTLDACAEALRLWLSGQLVTMVLVATLTTGGLWLLGVPAYLALGLAAPGGAGSAGAGGAAAPSPDPSTAMGVWGGRRHAPGRRPWGGVGWAAAPRHELGALHTAVVVLARRGDGQVCQAVLRELDETCDRYAEELRAAGVGPGQIADWRFHQLASAKPVTEFRPRVRLDDVTGTDVRNRADEHLGSVDDVLFDPRGGISHVVVARDGFLGLGQTRVAVPWERLQATPGLNTFVLDVGEEIDRFWQQQAG